MTALARDRWISAETEMKEEHYRGIVSMHLDICRAILSRGPGLPYLYADLHAGPGDLTYEGRTFDGSPLVFLRLAAEKGIRHQSLLFDQDVSVAARLSAAVSWVDSNGSVEVVAQPCEVGMSQWLTRAGSQPYRYGLVYSDPIAKEIPVALLARIAHQFPRVDLLSYVAATGYKRRGGPRLAEHLAAIDKRYVYVRQPAGQWQWTFVLWTNFESRLDWKRAGFHRADSERGRLILDRLNLTVAEFHEATNEPLFRMPGESK